MTTQDLEAMKPGEKVRIVALYHSAKGTIAPLASIKPKGAFVRTNGRYASEEFFLAGELERVAGP